MIHQKLSTLGRAAGWRCMPAMLTFGAVAVLQGSAITAQAATPLFGLFNTGIDPGVMLGVDNHYVEEAPGATTFAATYVTDTSNLPYSPPDNSTSQFLSPQAAYPAGVVDPGGVYDFKTTFSLTGVDTSKVSIQGRFESDDRIDAVLLNGHSLGIALTDPDYKAFSAYYNLTANPAFLVAGVNTIEFMVYNFAGTSVDPVTLRAEFVSAVPEPSIWAALGSLASLTLFAGWLRRRRATV